MWSIGLKGPRAPKESMLTTCTNGSSYPGCIIAELVSTLKFKDRCVAGSACSQARLYLNSCMLQRIRTRLGRTETRAENCRTQVQKSSCNQCKTTHNFAPRATTSAESPYLTGSGRL